MDFNKYYVQQAETAQSGLPVFRGVQFQRGYGIGNFFRRFISWAIPLLKQNALPIAQNIGKEVVENVAAIAKDAIEGKDIKESAKEKFKTSLEKIANQKGKGTKKKRKNSKPKDIFSSSDHVSYKKPAK